MANKFIEYLLEEKLKDITSGMLIMGSEREKKHSDQLEEYPYIDDDMLTFFEDAGASQEELFLALRGRNRGYGLSDLLIGQDTQNDKNKREKFIKFMPLINSNIEFYKDLLYIALQNHTYLSERFKDYNKEFFITLLVAGVKSGFLGRLKDSEKETQLIQYKDILIEYGAYDATHDVKETIELLGNKNSGDSKIRSHFIMHSDSIHELLNNLDKEKYEELTERLKVGTNGKILSEEIQFNLMVAYIIEAEGEKVIPLMDNKFIKEAILNDDKYNNKALTELIKHPKLLQAFLGKLNSQEKSGLFKRSHGGEGILIAHFTEMSKDVAYIDEKILSIILENIDGNFTDDDSQKKNLIITNLLFKQAKRINDNTSVNKLFEKYSKNIVNAIGDYKTKDSRGYFTYKSRAIDFKEFSKIIKNDLFEKIDNKIKAAEKDSIYIFNGKYKSQSKVEKEKYFHEANKYLAHLSEYINTTHDVSVLNALNADTKNPEWKGITHDYSISKKYFSEENLIVYLMRNAENDEVLEKLIKWVINESPDNFYELKFGTSDLLTYTHKISDSKRQETIFKKTVNAILSSEEAFDIILKKHKPKLKIISKIEDEEIQKKLNYYLLNGKLKKDKKTSNEVDVESPPKLKVKI